MIKFFRNHIYDINMTIKNKDGRRSLLIIALFAFLNAIKLASFNVILLGDTGRISDFIYKALLSLSFAILFTIFIITINNRWVFLAIYIIQSFYVFANLSYYLYFRSYLHMFQWISLVSEGFTVARNMIIPVGLEMCVIIIDLPLFIMLFFKFKKVKGFQKRMLLPALSVLTVAVITFVCAEISYKKKETTVHMLEPAAENSETVSVKRYGTLVNEVINIFTNSSDAGRIEKIKFGKELSSEKTKRESPNIVYIQVESMDSNIVNTKYGGEYVMPFLNNLCDNSVYYPYTLSYHLGGGTSDCEFSAINSVEAIQGFPALKLSGFDFSNSFVNKLKEGGYKTLAFHGNKAVFFTRKEAYPKMGYDKFYDIEALNLKESGWGASDGDLFNSAYKVLKKEKNPYFAHIITMTSHKPYTNIQKCDMALGFEGIKSKEVRNYFNSMRYVDKCLEEFIGKVKKLNKNTYFIIFGDHMSGIENEEYSICGYVYENKLFEFVPLYIITPDNLKYKEEKASAGFKDFSPTVLNISGIKYKVLSDGLDLLNMGKLDGEISFRENMYDRKDIFSKAMEKELTGEINTAISEGEAQ